MIARSSQYSGGSGTNPSVLASGETVSQQPTTTMIREVAISGQPAGLKQPRIGPGVEHVQHDEERQVVEDGADGSDEQNKPLNLANRPLARLSQPFGVNRIGRDGGLRKVVQQVVGQYLDRQHRQKRQG